MRQLTAMGIVALLAGCTAPSADLGSAHSPVEPAKPLVIAILDSGTIPSLPVFAIADDSFVHRAVPVAFEEFELSTNGTALERDEENKKRMEALTTGVLYHHAGTRLFGISMSSAGSSPTYDYVGHGAGTTYVAARDAPDAIIVSVQTNVFQCPDDDPLCVPESFAAGMEWIADQNWIDIVSVSLGDIASDPPPTMDATTARFVAASERAAANGKIVINAAGNFVIAPSITGYSNGPPWVISVGGYESTSHGEALLASKGVDVVANFSDLLPFGPDAMTWQSGTSFAAPVIAGTLAHAWHLIRQHDPTREVTPHELRAALNASAAYTQPTAWKPVPPPSNGLPLDPVRTSIPALTQPQMGWGYVHAGLAEDIARRVLNADLDTPAGKEQAAAFQPTWQQARETYWAQR